VNGLAIALVAATALTSATVPADAAFTTDSPIDQARRA
jgi:hypothetical protein